MNKYHPDIKLNRRCDRIMRTLTRPMKQTDIVARTQIDGYTVMVCLSALVGRGHVSRNTTDYTFERVR